MLFDLGIYAVPYEGNCFKGQTDFTENIFLPYEEDKTFSGTTAGMCIVGVGQCFLVWKCADWGQNALSESSGEMVRILRVVELEVKEVTLRSVFWVVGPFPGCVVFLIRRFSRYGLDQ
jgi:hypothetical protein